MREIDPDWDSTVDRFRRVVRMRGADRVADEIPADRATVFRILGGQTRYPSAAIRNGIRNVVEAREAREAEWNSGLRRS